MTNLYQSKSKSYIAVILPLLISGVGASKPAKKPAVKTTALSALKPGTRAREDETCLFGKSYRIGTARPIDIQFNRLEVKSKIPIKTLLGGTDTLESGDTYRFVVLHFAVRNSNAAPVAFFSTPDKPGQRPVLHMGVNAQQDSGDSFIEMEPRVFRAGSNQEIGSYSQNPHGNDIGPGKTVSAFAIFRVPRTAKVTQLLVNYSLDWQGASPGARESNAALASTLMTFDVSAKLRGL